MPVGRIDPQHVKLDYVHAVASNWVDRAHWASPKPWSVSPLCVVDGVAVLEIATLTDTAAAYLLDHVVPRQKVRFGSQAGHVLGPPQLMAQREWHQLAAADGAAAWTMQMLTPTTFRRGHRFSPWPEPRSVARSLMQRWNSLVDDPALTIRIGPDAMTEIWVSDVDGASAVFPVAGLTVSGFRGTVRYVCDDPITAVAFGSLARFAEFAGVGSYTTRGLGRILLV